MIISHILLIHVTPDHVMVKKERKKKYIKAFAFNPESYHTIIFCITQKYIKTQAK